MNITDPTILDYLHDATLIELRYDPSGDDRTVTILARCHAEAGHPAWDGRRLKIRLKDLPLLHFRGCGYCAGNEQIDSWAPNVSDSTAAELRALAATGIDVGGQRFTLTFHTSSYLEGVVREIAVEVLPD